MAHNLLYILVNKTYKMENVFKKSDMIFTDYKWTAYPKDDPRVTGEPDKTLFNRHEGYEVIYLINKLATMWSIRTTQECRSLEQLIRNQLPTFIRSQENVKEWIRLNWKR